MGGNQHSRQPQPADANRRPADPARGSGNAGRHNQGSSINEQPQAPPSTSNKPPQPPERPVKLVQVTSLAGETVTLQDDPQKLTVGAVRQAVGTSLNKPAECIKLINKDASLLVDEKLPIGCVLPQDDTEGVVELSSAIMPPRYHINAHRWEYVQLKFPGKEPETLQGQGMAVRADIILWEDRFERWDWKNGPALVNTAWKHPRFHSPGVTPGAIEHAVKGCSEDRPCEVVVVSEGWNNEDPDPEDPYQQGQLPVMDEAKQLLADNYPNIELKTMHGMYVAEEYNKQVKLGKSVVLLLHATC